MKKFTVVLTLFLLFLLSACEENKTSVDLWIMDTYCSVTVYGAVNDDTEKVVSQALEDCEKSLMIFENKVRFLAEEDNSEYPISNDIYEVLDLCLEVCNVSDGSFDVTTAPLTQLWDVNNASSPPSAADIENALENIGSQNISLTTTSLTVLNAGSGIDLGAVGKGYVGQKTADILKNKGLEGGLLNLGGNITVFGDNPNKDDGHFVIGIKDPTDASRIFSSVKVKNTNVVTAGGYERYFTYEGKNYHHILDPKTGYPAEKGILSVTVICENGVLADALSTAIYVSGTEKSIEILEYFHEEHGDLAAVIYCEDGTVKTYNTEKYSYTEYN